MTRPILMLVISVLATSSAMADTPSDAIDVTRAWLTAMHDHDIGAASRLTTTPVLQELCADAATEPTTEDAVRSTLGCAAKQEPFAKPTWTTKSAELSVVNERELATLLASYSKQRRTMFHRFIEVAKDHVVLRARVPLEKPTGRSCRNFELLFVVDVSGARIRAVVSAPLIKVC
jgi:hypothetical protein